MAKSFLIIGFAAVALVVVGVVVISSRNGRPVVIPVSDPVSTNEFALPADDPQLGRRIYVRCQACHGVDGKGVAGNYPSLVGNAVMNTDAAITLVLRGAERGVLSSSPWNGQMPAFADQLADHEIAAVLTWVRSQWGNQGSPVTAAAVRACR